MTQESKWSFEMKTKSYKLYFEFQTDTDLVNPNKPDKLKIALNVATKTCEAFLIDQLLFRTDSIKPLLLPRI